MPTSTGCLLLRRNWWLRKDPGIHPDGGDVVKADDPGRVWPLLLAGVVVLAVILTSLIDFGVDHSRIRLLDANVDSSWSHRATVGALAVGAAVALLAATRSVPARAWWGATAGILILLCLVEASPAHVQVDRLANGKLIYSPLLLLLVVCVWRLLGRSDQAGLMFSGLVALLVSYTIHIFGMAAMHALGWTTDSWGYQVRAALKEGTELAGWLLLVLALWRLAPPSLRARRGTWDLRDAPTAKHDATRTAERS